MLPLEALLGCTDPATRPVGEVTCGASTADAAPRRFDDDHVLVVPTMDGIELVNADGRSERLASWPEQIDGCPRCTGEGASADGDGLLVAVNRSSDPHDGGVARLDARGAVEWLVDGFAFPHDAVRDPTDDTIIVPESLLDRVSWVACDGSSSTPVRAMTKGRIPGFDGGEPNGADRLDWQGRHYLLLTDRQDGFGWTGSITLWDLADSPPALVWRFPATGGLGKPHSPILRPWQGRWWLLWAHTEGAQADGSSVGVAVTDAPTAPPSYVADLLPPAGAAPWGAARGVELGDDGSLWVTDSSTDGWSGSLIGAIDQATLPSLSPTGATGAAGEDQVFVRLDQVDRLVEGLAFPFEAWLWRRPTP